MVVRNLVDGLHISDQSPLSRFCAPYPEQIDLDKNVSKLRKGNNTYRATEKVRTELSERKSAARLPDEKAFWELVRIVFTETPNIFRCNAIQSDQNPNCLWISGWREHLAASGLEAVT